MRYGNIIGKSAWVFEQTSVYYRLNKEKTYTITEVKDMREVGDHYDHYVLKAEDGEEREVAENYVLVLPSKLCNNDEERVYNYLKDNGLYADISSNSLGEIRVEISWGDWKHEHGWCRNLMGYIGYDEDDEIVTEENGSDCYSSIHFFSKKQEVGTEVAV